MSAKIELPLIPRTFYCVGLNYLKHLKEAADKAGTVPNVPDRPEIGYRAQNALIAHDENVVIPASATEKIHYEGELVVVIGKTAKHLTEANAMDCVFGYTIGNDVSERNFQTERLGQWTKGKSHDTFGPVGPWLVTKDEIADVQNLSMWLDVNGQRRQTGSTKTMIFTMAKCISYVSQFMTLLPGDIITTGTPPGVGLGMKPPTFLNVGDVVTLGIEGLGEQRQEIVAA